MPWSAYAACSSSGPRAIAQVGKQLRGLYPDLVAVDELDPRERALQLRRHRNTGPATRVRSPRCTRAASSSRLRLLLCWGRVGSNRIGRRAAVVR